MLENNSKQMKELVLKGSYKGVSKISPMKTFDIIKSVIQCKSKNCFQSKKEVDYFVNQLKMKDNKDGTFYIYHMYNVFDQKTMKKTLSGRWYHMRMEFDKKKINSKNKTFTMNIKEYEDEQTLMTYPVDIIIHFNEKGWDKFIKFIGLDE